MAATRSYQGPTTFENDSNCMISGPPFWRANQIGW
jgi:hypothetical protein